MEKSNSPEQEPMEYEELRRRLVEAEETLEAIRSGEVDALVVAGPQGEQVFTLKKATRSYQAMVEEMNEGALTLSTSGTILYCNSRFAQILGLPMEKILGETFQRFIPSKQRPGMEKLLKKGQEAGAQGEFSLKIGKREIPITVSVRGVMLDETPRLTALVSDISARKQAEEIIRVQAEQYATLLSTTSDGFWLLDGDGQILDVNEAYCRLSGYSRAELVGLNINQVDVSESPWETKRHLRKVAQKDFDRFETQHRKKDGTSIDVEVSSTYFPATGNFLVFIHDISGRKQRQAKLENYRQNLEEMVAERTAQLKDVNTQLQAEIVEREKAEQTLRLSEEQAKKQAAELDAVISSLPGSITIYNKNGQAVRTNKLSDEYLGYTEAGSGKQAKGKAAQVQVLDANGKPVETNDQPVRKALAGEMVKNEILQIRRAAEEPLWLSSSAAPIYKDGILSGAVEVLTDITSIKAMEDELRRSEKKYRELVKYAPVGIYQLDFRTRKFTSVNEVVCEQTGYSREELLEMSPYDLLDKPSQALFTERLHRWLAGEKPAENVEYRLTARDGHEIYAVLNVTFTRDEQGAPLGATVVGYDITERKRLEQEIQDIANKYLLLFDSTSDGVWIHDQYGRILEVNEAYCRMSGYTEAELIGSSVTLVETWETPPEIGEHIRRLIEAGGHDRYETRHRRKDGSFVDVDITSLYLQREGGQVAIFVRDITERKKAEAALRESRDKYQALIETTGDFIWEMDASGRYTYCSPQMETLWGLKTEDMLGKTPFDLMPEAEKSAALELFGTVVGRGQPFSGLVTAAIVAEGREASVETNGVPFFDTEGNLLGFRGVSRDNTERKQAEMEARRLLAEVQAEKDRLAALVESMTDEVWFVEPSGKITLANPAAVRTFGIGIGDGLDSETFVAGLEVLRPDGSPRPLEEAPVFLALRGETMKSLGEIMRIPSTGQYRYRESNATPVRNPNGEIIGAIVVVRDVTERRQAEEMRERLLAQVERQAAELNSILESVPVGLSISDATGKVVRLNSAAERILHLRSPELSASVADRLGQLSITKEDGTPITQEESPTYQATQGKLVLDAMEVIHRDPQPQYLSVNAAPVKSADGTLLGVVTSFDDITRRKQVELELARSNARLTEVLDSIQDDFYVLDRDWKFVYTSRSFAAKVGKEPKDFNGNCIWEIFPKHAGTELEKNFRLSMEKGEVRRFEIDGKYTETVYSMTTFPSAEGITVLGSDITSRKRAEAEIARARLEAEQRADELEAIMEAVPVGLMLTRDPEGRFITGNRATHELLRVPLEESNISKSVPDPEGKRSYKPMRNGVELPPEELPIQMAAARGVSLWEWDIDLVFGDGEVRHAVINSTPLYNEKGEPRGAVAALIDVTERQNAEMELKRRAAELRAANAELKRFNTVMVGRELRMVELKKEINALCESLGQPQRYLVEFEKNEPEPNAAA